VRFKDLHKRAKVIDKMIDTYRISRKNVFPNLKDLTDIVALVFPKSIMVSFGSFKVVYKLLQNGNELAFKVGRKEAIEQDHQTYKRFPKDTRRAYFARIFWHTKYCLLQEHGIEIEVSADELAKLRDVAGEYGLMDINCANVRSFNGHLKIIDATIIPDKYAVFWRVVDRFRLKFPERLRKIRQKIKWIKGQWMYCFSL
jgi:hypothetical protein